ncbi:MAG: ComEC/Rec2 family competence protein [Chthonomonadales bacterium]
MTMLRRNAPNAILLTIAAAVAAVWLTPLPRQTGVFSVTVLDVGQGDAIVLRTPAGHVLIVDAGRTLGSDDEGRRVVLPYLRSQGIRRVNALLLTHPDDDHVGGAVSILDRIPVDRLIVSPIRSAAWHYLRAIRTARRRGIPILQVVRGNIIRFHDGVTAQVLNPPADPSKHGELRDNSLSIVMRVQYGATACLLTGDADLPAERDMLASGVPLRAEVLKLGHHGSKSSSSDAFLDAVRPRIAIVSAGLHNSFGHPHPEVLTRLQARRIAVYRTDYQGAIRAISNGKQWRVSTSTAIGAPAGTASGTP